MTAKAGKKRRTEHSDGSVKLGKLALISCIGMAVLIGFLFLASAICLHLDASGRVLPLSAYLCCTISAFIIGCFAAKSVGKSGLLCGLLSSVPLCILLLILCLTSYGSVGSGFLLASSLLAFSGAAGGVAALNIRRKRRYR